MCGARQKPHEWEADQRHAELLIAGVGLLPDSKPLSSPGRKLTTRERDQGDQEELSADEASKFRGLAARANFLTQDRPGIAFSVKELCRSMPRPTTRDVDGG